MAKKVIKIMILGLVFGLINFRFIKISTFKVTEMIDNSFFKGINLLNDEYVATLEIPKINLKKGFYSENSKYNNIKYGIEIVASNVKYLVLASHSGNALISYFKNLNKLEVGDDVIIWYQDQKFLFKIKYFYDIDSDNPLEILSDNLAYKIILITCDNINLNKKIVYVGELTK